MDDPNTIKSGKYKTVNGDDANVWDWGQNLMYEWCYRGTIQGQGFCTWDKDGKDLDGNSNLVLQ